MSRYDISRAQDERILEAMCRLDAGESAAAVGREMWPNQSDEYLGRMVRKIRQESAE